MILMPVQQRLPNCCSQQGMMTSHPVSIRLLEKFFDWYRKMEGYVFEFDF